MNKLPFKFLRLLRNLIFDFKYGGFLGGVVRTRFSIQGANDTANSDYEVLPFLFQDNIESDDIFVDVGCGKGRVLNWWLDSYVAHSIYGIELDPDIASSTAARLRGYDQVKILCGSAAEILPDGKLLIYIFNPFNCSVMDCFMKNLLSRINSGKVDKRSRIIYYNSVCLDVFSNRAEFFISEIDLPPKFHRAYLISVLQS